MAKTTFAQQAARDDFSVRQERALLVGVLLDGKPLEDDPLAELAELVRAAGGLTVDRVVQRRQAYEAASCVGKGKLEEIRQRCDAHDVDVVVFDNDLSPSQIREIEKVASRKVLDRSELILDIFASRARSAEARLQVELAQLEYTAPRLRGMWTHLERIAGGAGGGVVGIGTRGPGERQIEIDRRLVQKRVAFLKDKLDEIDRRKVREVRAREEFFTISLVGYTNAGKSTLMNALTGAGTLTEDKLFATLDTLTRRWDLAPGRFALLSDTVGFIRDLPHHLVASFRATLEEAIHADLLLHVVDASSPEAERQIAAVEGVLDELGMGDKPVWLLFNKSDALTDDAQRLLLQQRYPEARYVSARTGEGLDALRLSADALMGGELMRRRISLPAEHGKALVFVERFADILARSYEDGRVVLDVRISPRSLRQLHSLTDELKLIEEPAEPVDPSREAPCDENEKPSR